MPTGHPRTGTRTLGALDKGRARGSPPDIREARRQALHTVEDRAVHTGRAPGIPRTGHRPMGDLLSKSVLTGNPPLLVPLITDPTSSEWDGDRRSTTNPPAREGTIKSPSRRATSRPNLPDGSSITKLGRPPGRKSTTNPPGLAITKSPNPNLPVRQGIEKILGPSGRGALNRPDGPRSNVQEGRRPARNRHPDPPGGPPPGSGIDRLAARISGSRGTRATSSPGAPIPSVSRATNARTGTPSRPSNGLRRNHPRWGCPRARPRAASTR